MDQPVRLASNLCSRGRGHRSRGRMRTSKSACRCARSLVALALAGGFCEQITHAASFKIERPGLTDPPHKADGSTQIQVFDPDGAIGGCAARYNPAGAYNGCTAWVLDNGTSRVTGLFGSEFTRNDGFYDSSAFRAGGDAQYTGSTDRYNSTSNYLGAAVWFYDHGTTTRMGFFDALHTDTNGKQQSNTLFVNEAGNAVGTSQEFPSGQSAWIFRNGITTRIGLMGSDYT